MSELSFHVITLGQLHMRARLRAAVATSPLVFVHGRDVTRLGIKRLSRAAFPAFFYPVCMDEASASESCLFALAGRDPEAVAAGVEAQLNHLLSDPQWQTADGSSKLERLAKRCADNKEPWLKRAAYAQRAAAAFGKQEIPLQQQQSLNGKQSGVL